MSDKPTSVKLSPEDYKLVKKLRKACETRFPGFTASFSLVMRLALKSLAKDWEI